MSLLGAMNAAVSGLAAQSDAFGNISDNVANSQTVGFKRVDTSFTDFLTSSTKNSNDPGSVIARPDYVNSVQGTVTQSDNPLNLAIAGQGFFAVSQQNGQANGTPTFNPLQFYSRAGDFSLNKDGYMVNSSGQFLNGWPVNATTGAADQNSLVPIQIPQTVFNPVATSTVDLSANLPATPAAGTATVASPITSTINVYDSLGTAHAVTLSWVQTPPVAPATSSNDWTVTINAPDALTPAIGTAEVQFGTASANPVPAGTVGQIIPDNAGVTSAGYSAGGAATMNLTMDFGSGPQTVALGLGTYGGSGGLTQFAGTDYALRGLTQNGVPPGSFDSVTTQANGNVVVNYDNGQKRTIAQVPLIMFNNPDGLQRQNGQSFTVTSDSGAPSAQAVNTNGAGNLATNAVESSNVDIAAEFTKLIVAQRAYAANTKIVTTSDELLQQTIDMKR